MSTSFLSRLGGCASQETSAIDPNIKETYERWRAGVTELIKSQFPNESRSTQEALHEFSPEDFPPYQTWYSRSAEILADYSVPGGMVDLKPGESLMALPQPAVRLIKCDHCGVTNSVSHDYRCVACGAPL